MIRTCRGGLMLFCAWILWQHIFYEGHPTPGDISVIGALETKAECEQGATRLLNRVKRQHKGATLEGFALTSRDHMGVMRHLMMCLPDTIDPRQPK